MHLKPSDSKTPFLDGFLFFADWILAVTFQITHIYFFVIADFKQENNHVLHVLIGAGFTTMILIYSITDGVRFLRSHFDKLLYLLSCLLQKPLLLPVLMPSRFRSRIATKHLETHSQVLERTIDFEGKQLVERKEIQPTNFLLAVQETNFLYSFTLSGFVAATTACTMLIENDFSDPEFGSLNFYVMALSLIYFIFGVFMSITRYGRKTKYLHDFYAMEEEALFKKKMAEAGQKKTSDEDEDPDDDDPEFDKDE